MYGVREYSNFFLLHVAVQFSQHNPLIIRDRQIKTAVRHNLTPVKMAIIEKKNLQTINAREGIEKREPSCTVGGNTN